MLSFHQVELLPTTILFLAETNLSPSIVEQRASCEAKGDVIVEAGKTSFLDLPKKLAQSGYELRRGDRIKIYDLTCLSVNTARLIGMIVKLLRKGVTIEFCSSRIVLDPDAKYDEPFRLLVSLDNHWRRIHGMKTHPPHTKTGKKQRISADRLPEIEKMLAAEGASVAAVAVELGIPRTTLHDYMRRHAITAPASPER
ncbi:MULTISPECIES: Hin recombinase [Rhizorhabdus]|uniref:Hin recombinase n=1 Tax=Rhizorhabdus TaxID=1649486 RepID=UPI0012FD0689|nr:Hin recombinase [Rhizorhabdus wittichii]